MKNPDWNREELILALDLYFDLDYGQMHGKNKEVVRLSNELRSLSIHQSISINENFRSVNSVGLKLANFKKLDQNFTGRGMRAGAKLDTEIWKEFHRHRDKLKSEADLVRQLYLNSKIQTSTRNKLQYQNFAYQLHKNRETDPFILKYKLDIIQGNNKIRCEVCSLDVEKLYGEIGKNIIEMHYTKEVKQDSKRSLSEIEDFILVCPNCHKILEEQFEVINAEDLKRIIKKK